jgi:hypothetical protein
MIEFERTTDYALVRAILTHPAIYPHITDDGCPAADQFQVLEHPSIWYVLVRDGAEVLGLWMFAPQGAACWEVHTCLLPCAYGDRAKQASRAMAEWIFTHTPCQRIVTTVPAYNRLALRFAERAGMTRFGTNERSYLKGNTLHNQILLGLSKCQQQ